MPKRRYVRGYYRWKRRMHVSMNLTKSLKHEHEASQLYRTNTGHLI